MDDNFNKHLGNKLKLRRLALGLTQTKVAKAINVTFQQIQKYEKGTNGVSSSRLLQLAVFLKVPVNYFYEDYSDNRSEETSPAQDNQVDLNYSFLVKIFNKLSTTQKTKIVQILKNTSDLKETG